ncbi:MAG: Endonuclease [Bacteroidota bacterium]|nr:Endonuclease [Bacteroidota bacterium]
MSEGIVLRFAGTLSLLSLLFIKGYPQDTGLKPVRLMFYNVENLFDTLDDTLREDDEFLPYGIRRWNSKRYYLKINSLYKTIAASGEWDTQDIIGLCEVENRKVLEDLIYSTNLSRYDFGLVHEDSPDPRGIDVGLIYRKDRVKILRYSYLSPPDFSRHGFRTRSVLHAECVIYEDTIHLFVNHWPSRRGGVLAAETQRSEIALMVSCKTDSISEVSDGKAKIIIMGDFNSTPDDQVIISSGSMKLINLSERLPAGSGTYRYMGTWELIDQVIVSESLINSDHGLYTSPELFRIFKPDFLLKSDPKYPGVSPFSTYRGYRYQGGYSDHLPVILDLKNR